MSAHPLIAVLGPTAAGKSSLALALARRFNGEIVNYDSVQVYRGFDIGSAKPSFDERRAAPHHLIDILDPREKFSAGEYARRARQVLGEIRRRGRTPILAGGTGFYLRALLDGLFAGQGRDESLRRRLTEKAGLRGSGYIHRVLARLDPESARRIHPNDVPKLVRAIEVCLREGRPASLVLEERGRQPLEGFDILRIGLDPPRELLGERIASRTAAMFEGGLLQEVRGLLEQGVPRGVWAFGAVGYRQALACVEGRITLPQAIDGAVRATREYAKRQVTWFRNQERAAVRLGGFGDEAETRAAAFNLAEEFLRRAFSKGRN